MIKFTCFLEKNTIYLQQSRLGSDFKYHQVV